VLCVALKDAQGTLAAVVQLMNKTGAEDAAFTPADAEAVRSGSGADILHLCDGMSLHQLLTMRQPPPSAPSLPASPPASSGPPSQTNEAGSDVDEHHEADGKANSLIA
jgi:hypothetical protein